MKIKLFFFLSIINSLLFMFGGSLMSQSFSIKSTDFINNGFIPEKNSCDNDSPHLIISGVPANTKNLILLIEDPDAKNGHGNRKTFIHLIAQFDPNIKEIPEGEMNKAAKKIINNDLGKDNYFGPCPPEGPAHSYFFTLIALNKMFDISNNSADYFRNTWNYHNPTQTSRFYNEVKPNILGITQLMGKFQKK